MKPRRYSTRPRAWATEGEWESVEPERVALTVFEMEEEPRGIGILDIHGNEYTVYPERKNIGFFAPVEDDE